MADEKLPSAERCPTHPGAILREMVSPAMAAIAANVIALRGDPVHQATAARFGLIANAPARRRDLGSRLRGNDVR
jgi:hypothetical protein